jgi:hypothetical protein
VRSPEYLAPSTEAAAATQRELVFPCSDRAVGGFGFLMRIAYGGQPRSPELAQRAHHVKDHARLARLIEVQIVPHFKTSSWIRVN